MSFSAGVGASQESANSNSNTYGTRTPNLSADYTTAYNNLVNGAGTTGANPAQQTAMDWFGNNLNNNPVHAATATANGALGQQSGGYDNLNKGLTSFTGQSAPQIGNTAQASVASSANAPMVTAQTGASDTAPYMSLLNDNLINPALQSYDYGTDRAFSALDARTAGAGAFGNTRSGLGYSDLGAQAGMGRAQLEAGLRAGALTSAFGFGQQDAGRSLTADTTNASNIQNNNQFNAGQANSASQFNAGQTNATSQANLSAQQTKNAQNLQAAQQVSANLAAQTGLSQQVLNNIVTANGIDMQTAQSLFASGAITQSQLNAIAAMAGNNSNGFSFTQNNSSNSSANKTTETASASFP